MRVKRIQIINYGPIGQIDIDFPFDGDSPKPVVLVGGNGSGKSILLSHIVNGLVTSQSLAYPETPEVETGKVFKLRDNSYIKSGCEGYFAQVDYEDGLFMGEVRLRLPKREYIEVPLELQVGGAKDGWNQMPMDSNDRQVSNVSRANEGKIRELFSSRCVLYFPSNRFEEPAWLNESNLKAQAEYMGLSRLQGYTNRRVINYSPLRDNQNWLFDVVYDRAVFEAQTVNFPLTVKGGDQSVNVPQITVPLLVGHSGNATSVFDIALEVLRLVMNDNGNARFGIGRRLNRVLSLVGDGGTIVPNIFQLSSGETSLLNLFFSILRDFDLCGAPLTNAAEVKGIAVVDEIDLHLHTAHQHQVLPGLMRMFPKVQFIVTTHSPLFILGMAQTLGEDGFALYRLPQGQPISPEEFSEFGDAYQAFTATSKFSDDIRAAVRDAQSPILYMEGKTDVQYLKRAATLLGQNPILDGIEVDEREGGGNLRNIWDAVKNLPPALVPRRVLLLHDCDFNGDSQTIENRFKRKIPFQIDNPIEKGIENLFGKGTLEKALDHKPDFIDVVEAHPERVRGIVRTAPEKWAVNKDEKTNLCNWICENGTAADFEGFQVIFELLEEALGTPEKEPCNSA